MLLACSLIESFLPSHTWRGPTHLPVGPVEEIPPSSSTKLLGSNLARSWATVLGGVGIPGQGAPGPAGLSPRGFGVEMSTIKGLCGAFPVMALARGPREAAVPQSRG